MVFSIMYGYTMAQSGPKSLFKTFRNALFLAPLKGQCHEMSRKFSNLLPVISLYTLPEISLYLLMLTCTRMFF
jgi:hypothetical protein